MSLSALKETVTIYIGTNIIPFRIFDFLSGFSGTAFCFIPAVIIRNVHVRFLTPGIYGFNRPGIIKSFR
jgi:hypothetical protein